MAPNLIVVGWDIAQATRGLLLSSFLDIPDDPSRSRSSRSWVDVVHDVIVVRFAGNYYWIDATGDVVEFKQVTHLPRNVVIGA